MPRAPDDGPRNIVLFSDGTGNSASKAFKTNVWRTYQALDLRAPGDGERPQIARYKDGVGTETFKPLALLGGAFGFGLMRDVRALYTFLCRNYREGDHIYAFGFSRGAFTIRVLVGLVATCGLVQTKNENQLFHYVSTAYKAFRRHMLIRAAASKQRPWMIYDHVLAPPCYEADGRRIALHLPTAPLWPHVDFLGLWDTVDAYGMPVEELKQGIDKWIWPMTLADRKLPKIVDRAYHALCLDDERPTFRPVLWDESDPIDAQRLEQRWFAGVHSNVGGGYPIDDLAYVPLLWMLDKAKAAGLRFCDDQVRFFEELSNVHGTGYDSRAGVAGYYRYGPRSLEKLCNDDRYGVHLKLRLMHPSVAERIAARHVAYSPLGLPRDLALKVPGTDTTVMQDVAYVDFAWDAVFWRRITYFATVFLTALLALSPWLPIPAFDGLPPPLCHGPGPCARWPISGSLLWVADWFVSAVAWVPAALLGLLPAWTQRWVCVLEAHTFLATPIILALAWLFFGQSAKLQRNIGERSEWAWSKMKGNAAVDPVERTWLDRLAWTVRTSPKADKLGRFYDRKLIPNAVGLLLLVLIWSILVVAVCKAFAALCGFWLGVAVLAAFVATCWSSLNNAPYRNLIAEKVRPLEIPERRWTYTASDLATFKTAANAIPLADGRTVLQVYHGPVLLPNDLIFAVSLGLFVILTGRLLAQLALALPSLHWLFHASAFLGFLYAAFDVTEDMMLARIFGSQDVPPKAAKWAPWMTRAKRTCLALSVTGLLLFGLLTFVGNRRKPGEPSRF